MKYTKTKLGIGALAATLLAVSASAGTISVSLADLTLNGGEFVDGSFDTSVGAPQGAFISLTISFDYSEAISDGSWASDVVVNINNGTDFVDVGGFDTPINDPAAWSFDGPASTDPGFYSSTFFPAGDWALGNYNFFVLNDWAGDPNANTYSNMTFDFLYEDAAPMGAPEPSVLALLSLGLLGLCVGVRRRRIR